MLSTEWPPRLENALNASAWILDSAADVESKYSRDASKEYEGLSAEMKKWFKRLAVSLWLASYL